LGAFFTNVQLLSPKANKLAFTDSVTHYIIDRHLKKKFILTDNPEETETAVIISDKGEDAWISIYDEATENQELSLLQKLASQLSKKFKTTALAILVHDSDMFYLEVFKNGFSISRLDNLSGEIDFDQVNKEPWNILLKQGFFFDDLILAWKNKSPFVEDFLKNIGSFINIDANRILNGYNYASEEKNGDHIPLNFKSEKTIVNEEQGPVRFTLFSGVGGANQKIEDELFIPWTLINRGCESKGLKIVIAGSAIGSQLIAPIRVEMNYYRTDGVKSIDFASDFEEHFTFDKEKIYVAEMPDVIIKKGIHTALPLNSRQGLKYMQSGLKSAMTFNFKLNTLMKGEGQLMIWFVPLENPKDGLFSTPQPINFRIT
jgi:hypothetical protein